jgi:ElaB/YqjD/DUF883 family membrane-anchored ribosome-binding protein
MPTPKSSDATTPHGDGAAADPIQTDEVDIPAADTAGSDAPPATDTPTFMPPPIPSSYEMPDDYATETWLDRTKEWVEQNPALAVLAAAGIGLVVGRLVTALVPEPEPPTLTKRVEARAEELSKAARKRGKKLAAEARSRAHDAGDVLSSRFETAAEAAGEGFEKSRDLAESIADAVKVAVAGVAAKKVEEWVSRARR